MATKLSKTQKEVIRLMRDNWELGVRLGIEPTYWMQKGGLGNGGESKYIRSSTFFALLDKDLIKKREESYPRRKYKLTELGKNIEL